MKYILLITCFFLLFSSCVKIKEAPLCSNSTPKPQLSSSSYQYNLGDTLTIPVKNPDNTLIYTWYGPDDFAYTGKVLKYANNTSRTNARWAVISRHSGDECTNDSTIFYVTGGITMPSCGEASNSLTIGSTTSHFEFDYGYDGYYDNYILVFLDTYTGQQLNIKLPSQPYQDQVYTFTSNSTYYGITGYANYSSIATTGGSLTIKVSPYGTISMGACNLTFTTSGYTYNNCKANFTATP